MRRRKVSGRASKPKSSNYVSGPFLPTQQTPNAMSPTILIITITSACTPALVIKRLITLTNNFFDLVP